MSASADTPTLPRLPGSALDRRAVYRVKPQETKRHVALLVETASGEVIGGEVADLSIKGAAAWLSGPAERLPILDLGEQVRLVFLLPDLPHPVVMHATVRAGLELHEFRRYGFEFEEPEQLESSLPRRLFALLNRRRAYRAEPLEELVVVALRTSDGATVIARLKDLSTSGMGILVEAHADAPFAVGERVEVSMRLPTQLRDLKLVAWIRHGENEGKAVRYGLEFDQECMDDFKRQQEVITEFVLSCLAGRDSEQEQRFQ